MGGIRGKSFLIPRIKIVRERKMLISAKLKILCSENCHIYINCMQTKFSTRQKKNNPLLLLMLIWRDLSLKEAFYDLHYFWIGAQYQGFYLYYVAILFKDSMIIDVTKSTICTTLFTRLSVGKMKRTTTLFMNGTYPPKVGVLKK